MRSSVLISLVLLAAATLSGCGGSGGGDGKKAQIRLLNVSTGYQSLDVYTNNENNDDDDDASRLSAVGYGTVSDYSKFDSDTYSVKFKRAGVSATLLTLSGQKLTDESHYTYVAYGSSGNFGALPIAEDQADADGGKSRIAVYNVAEAGSVDVYITEESVDLGDASPNIAGITSGGGGSSTTVDSGTYRIRITGTGDATDMRLDVSGVEFTSKQVSSLILTATQGGVLVNAILLPQQGSVTTFLNTKARVRGAVGISNGTTATATIGGVSVIKNYTNGVIGSKYEQVTAGSLSVGLGVDGTAVSVPDQTLVAGGDYTLLVWTNSSGATTTSLITDDNRLPTTASKVKIRLLNGMSSLGAPNTLVVDYSPIIEDVEVGTASSAVETNAGTDFQVDVWNSTTSAPLRTQASVTLQAASVYTMFTAGGGTTAVTGTLRKDR